MCLVLKTPTPFKNILLVFLLIHKQNESLIFFKKRQVYNLEKLFFCYGVEMLKRKINFHTKFTTSTIILCCNLKMILFSYFVTNRNKTDGLLLG